VWEKYRGESKEGLGEKIQKEFDQSWAICVEGWCMLEWLYRVSRTLLPDPRDTDVNLANPHALPDEPNQPHKPATCLAAEAIRVLNGEYLDLDVATLELMLPTSKPRSSKAKKKAKKRAKDDELKEPMKKLMKEAKEHKVELDTKLKVLEGRLALFLPQKAKQKSPKSQKPTDWRDYMLMKSVQRLYTAWECWKKLYLQLKKAEVKCGDLNQTIRLLTQETWLPPPSSAFSSSSSVETNLELMCRTFYQWRGEKVNLNYEIPHLLGEKRHTHKDDSEPTKKKGEPSLLRFEKYKKQADYLRTMEKMLGLSMNLVESDTMRELCSVFKVERQKFEECLRFPNGAKKEGNTLQDLSTLQFIPPLVTLKALKGKGNARVRP
jgi:hypothetical protein